MADTNPKTIRSTNQLLELNTSKDVETSKQSSSHTDTSNATLNYEDEYLTGIKLLATMFSLTLVGFLMLLDTSIIATAIPKITTEFHSLDDVGWYGTSYLIASCSLQPLTGKLYTHFNIKWTLLCFFATFELGSALCGAAVSSDMLIIARAISGLGASGILNGGFTIIHRIVSPAKKPLYLGILTGVAQLGVIAGPLFGGLLTEFVSWRWCFYINLPCGAAVFTLLFFVQFPELTTKRAESETLLQTLGKLDPFGFALFAPAAIQLILALQWGGVANPWNSATIIGIFCGAAGTLLVFLAWEHRMKDSAMIPLSIMKQRVIWTSCMNIGCLFGSMLLGTYYLPIYFQAVRNATPTMSGVDLLPSIASTMIYGIATGALVGHFGYYLPFAIVGGVLATIGSGLLSILNPTTSIGAWIGYQIILGGGRGFGFQIPITAVQNNASKEHVSTATAMVVFSQVLGGAVFIAGTSHFWKSFERVIIAGATAVRDIVTGPSLPGVILAYSKAFDNVMYLAAGVGGGQLLFSLGMGWVNIKKMPPINGEKWEERV